MHRNYETESLASLSVIFSFCSPLGRSIRNVCSVERPLLTTVCTVCTNCVLFFFQQSDWCCWCDSFLFCRHQRRVCCPIYHFLSVTRSLRRSADRNFCRTVSQAVASRLITRLLLYNNGSLAFRWRMGEDSMSGSERMDLRIGKKYIGK